MANAPCFANSWTDSTVAGVTTNAIIDLTNRLIPTAGASIPGNGLVVGSEAGVSAPVWPIPVSVSSFDVLRTIIQKPNSVPVSDWNSASFNTCDSSGNWLAGIGLGNLLDTGPRKTSLSRGLAGVWPTAATYYGVHAAHFGSPPFPSPLSQVSYSTNGVCAGPNLEPGCCPPDPSIDARLNQIITYLQFLMNHQQTGASTGWVDGVRHVGVTGAGHLDFVGKATAVRAEVTTVPPSVSIVTGDPTFYWDLGFITPLAIDIPLRGQRLVFNPEIFAMPPQATGVSWSLTAGAVADLIELEPA
jgi:hypothetical protein